MLSTRSRRLAALQERLLWALGVPASLLPGCTSAHGTKADASNSPALTDTGTSRPSDAPDVGTDATTMACGNSREEQQCMTRSELIFQAAFGVQQRAPAERKRSDEEAAALILPNGCLPPEYVHNGCCNAPIGAGVPGAAEGCCYSFCLNSCCGRPFLVAGSARVADVTRRRDWLASLEGRARTDTRGSLSPSLLAATVRSRLAEVWRRDAQLEHASVAAFARFTLELLSLGAPAELVSSAQQAGLDEVEHARLCFALASRYAGHELGPDKLALGDCRPAHDLRESVRVAVIEGCIGETLAAASAQARLDGARCPDVREVLTRIVEDETRHAELSFRFLAWALTETEPGGLEAELEGALERERQRLQRTDGGRAREVDHASLALREHGVLGAAEERALHEQTLRLVIAPCLRAAMAVARQPSNDLSISQQTQSV